VKVEDTKATEEEVSTQEDALVVEENTDSDLEEVSDNVEESTAEEKVEVKKIENEKLKKATIIIEPKV